MKVQTTLIQLLRMAFACLFVLLTGCASNLPKHIGLNQHQLPLCPSSPNCVSSYDMDEEHYIKPILFSSSQKNITHQLINIFSEHSNIELISLSNNYIHAQYSSNMMGFIDDIELLILDQKIHIRSASRLGYSDFGANRKHIEMIRTQLQQH